MTAGQPAGRTGDRVRHAAGPGLLDAVSERIRRFYGGDVAAVMAPDALMETAALLLTDPAEEPDGRRVAGLLFWYRCTQLDDDTDHNDLAAALALLGPVWRIAPHRVPDEIGEFFVDVGVNVVRPTDAWHGPALALTDHVRATGDPAAATLTVALLRRVLDDTPEPNEEWARCAANLAGALLHRYEVIGAGADLDEAIGLARRAAAAFGERDRDRLVPLAALAVALRRRSGRTGDARDLDEAVTVGRAVVAATPADGPTRSERLSNLGVALCARYEWGDRSDDLAAAVAAHREAVATGGGTVATLTNLSSALLTSYRASGSRADLDDAVALARDVAARVGDDPGTAFPAAQSGLCAALWAAFAVSNRADDLDEAVQAGERAADRLPEGHPDRVLALTNLGLARLARWHRYGRGEDVERSIDVLRGALDGTAPGHPDRPWRLSNLGDALLARGAAGDLDEAVELGREAAAAAHAGPRRYALLANLGNALLTRFESGRRRGDLDEAYQVGDDAAATCPADGPDTATCLANFAVTAYARFERDGAVADRDRAIAVARTAARSTGPPVVRVRAAARWGHWSADAGDWATATTGLGDAVSLLERIAPRGLPRADQDHELGRLGSLGSDAAACALRTGATAEALALLERGRAIVLAHALDDEPAAAFRLDAPDVSTWTALAAYGPVVVVNVSRHRSDALLVTPAGIAVEPLPALDPDTLRAVVERFLVAIETRTAGQARAGGVSDDGLAAAERTLTGILEWLWATVAAPVLDRLDRDAPSWRSNGDARVWWCPTGLLSLLPLSAAGRYGTGRGWFDSVPGRVVSSITPTLWALGQARRAAESPGPPEDPDLLVVAVPDGVGGGRLPAARAECELLTSLFPGRVTDLSGSGATTGDVLDSVRRHRRLHVAGHAVADVLDPARSRLFVARDGAALTAADIGRVRLPGAELAYLSACGTARPGTTLADEIVHLASTLHVAGFRHVVGTLWPIGDRPALRMARAVYGDLAGHDDPARLANAVRTAVRALRDRYPNHPSAWAATVHIGP